MTAIRSVPRPLVQTNQTVIVLSVVLTWLSGQAWLLLIPLLAGLLGLLFAYNPIMHLAKRFLRKPASAYIPEDWDQQQFNQKIAVVCLALGFLGYMLNWPVLAYAATIMVAAAAGIALCGFCIGCFIRYQWMQYQYKKKKGKSL